MPEAATFVTGIVLAAGASRRMGRPKQLLPYGGRTLLAHVVEQATASRLDEIVVVLGHRADEVQRTAGIAGDRVRMVANDRYEQGLGSSLTKGLEAADARAGAAAILLADQPGVSHRLIDRVLDAAAASDQPIVRPVFKSASGGRMLGHPVVLARVVWRWLDSSAGDAGARRLIESRPQWVTEVELEGDSYIDIDTPEDYYEAAVGPGGLEQNLRYGGASGDRD